MGLYFKIGKTCECNSLMELTLACTGGRNVAIGYLRERNEEIFCERSEEKIVFGTPIFLSARTFWVDKTVGDD